MTEQWNQVSPFVLYQGSKQNDQNTLSTNYIQSPTVPSSAIRNYIPQTNSNGNGNVFVPPANNFVNTIRSPFQQVPATINYGNSAPPQGCNCYSQPTCTKCTNYLPRLISKPVTFNVPILKGSKNIILKLPKGMCVNSITSSNCNNGRYVFRSYSMMNKIGKTVN